MFAKHICFLLPAFLLPAATLADTAEIRSRPPNFILLMADDLGYADLGVTGSTQIPTPHIDRLAADGVFFSNGYVTSPVCAPSRAGLMTGKHQVTFGFRDNLAPVQPGHDPEFIGLPLDQTTLADRLKELGYTNGLIGKWHLGEGPRFGPLMRGFDEFWGWLGGAHDYFTAEPGDNHITSPIICNFKKQGPLTYLTDDQGNESVDFIRRHKDRPFFLFTSFAAPHTPMQALEEDLDKFSHIEGSLRRTYCAMVYRMDRNIGKILDEVRAQGLEQDTFVIFLSDNGGMSTPILSNGAINAPFRGSKTTVLEGGIRVPMIFKWPAVLPAGKTVDESVSALDFVPTIVHAAGGAIGGADRLHGVDLLPFLTGDAGEIQRGAPLKWLYTVGTAIRDGEWKLVQLPDRLPALYHLPSDPAELNDVSLEHPDRTRTLLRELGLWDIRAANPVFREPADWRQRHIRFYDVEYQLIQPAG